MVKRDFYRTPPFSAAVRHALEHVPRTAAVVAPDFLVAHLATRDAAYELAPRVGNPPGYLVTGLVEPVGNILEHANYREYQQDVERRLPLYEPAFYEAGWIVLRLRPGGPNTGGNGVLAPLPRGPANRLLPAYTSWETSFTQTEGRVLACAVTLARSDPAGAACSSGIGASLLAGQAVLDRRLSVALGFATGGCRQLGDLARAGAVQIAADVQRLRETGARGATAGLYAFAADVNDRDLPGLLTRFLELCYPRPLPPLPPLRA
jgi:hypothetical protein